MKRLVPGLVLALSACGGVLDLGSDTHGTTNTDASTSNQPRRVFVTSTQYQGNALGGIAGADAKCAASAAQAGLSGTYLAWLSTAQTSPAQRMTHHPAGYQLVDGTAIASDWADLVDGTIAHAIDVTEHGTSIDTPATSLSCRFLIGAWSATGADGMLAPQLAGATDTCNDWMGVGYSGRMGAIIDTSGATDQLPTWSDSGCVPGCGNPASLYCVEQ